MVRLTAGMDHNYGKAMVRLTAGMHHNCGKAVVRLTAGVDLTMRSGATSSGQTDVWGSEHSAKPFCV